jgi:hypothetical protein
MKITFNEIDKCTPLTFPYVARQESTNNYVLVVGEGVHKDCLNGIMMNGNLDHKPFEYNSAS